MKRFRGGEYPVTYYCQCMHYMAVTRFPKWYLAVLVDNREFFWYEIPRDEGEISALMSAEKQFWAAVEEKKAPAMDGSSSEAEALNDMYQDEGGEADLSPCAGDIQEYLAVEGPNQKAPGSYGCQRDRIKAVMGANRIGSLGGATVSWAAYSSSRLDKAALQAEHPEINLNAYKKVTTATAVRSERRFINGKHDSAGSSKHSRAATGTESAHSKHYSELYSGRRGNAEAVQRPPGGNGHHNLPRPSSPWSMRTRLSSGPWWRVP